MENTKLQGWCINPWLPRIKGGGGFEQTGQQEGIFKAAIMELLCMLIVVADTELQALVKINGLVHPKV